MTEQYGSSNPTPDPSRRGQRRSRRGWIIAGTLAGVLALGVAVATTEYGGGWHHGGRMSAEAFSEHLDYHVKQILSEVDATPEQEAQVTTILQAAASDLYAMKAQHKAAHEELRRDVTRGWRRRDLVEAFIALQQQGATARTAVPTPAAPRARMLKALPSTPNPWGQLRVG